MANDPAHLKAQILALTREYARAVHASNAPAASRTTPFVPGSTVVPYAGRVFNEDEVEAAVGSMLDFWLTLGPEGEAFETELAGYLGVRSSLLVNSGSSANLLAVTALTSHKLPGDRRLKAGDEVITAAAGFPTTVAPIIQNGAVAVFIDVNPITGNILPEHLEAAFSPGKTKAVMLAHTLGNPFDLGAVLSFCKKHALWLIEDNCDALGSTYSLPMEEAKALGFTENSPGIPSDGIHLTRFTGAWGDLSTQSFYPPHHLTLGEGGCVNIVRQASLRTYVESFRDWGRDCWCASGKDNTCNKRFGWQLGELPAGYDHKYIYSHLGYNLKPLDPQAAIGRAQLKKLPGFVGSRRSNWAHLRKALSERDDLFEFSLPTHASTWEPHGFTWGTDGRQSDPSWFGFMLRVRAGAPFSRTDLARALERAKIGNRMLFGGNLVRQPAYVQLARDKPGAFRVAAPLTGSDALMDQALFVGTYPGLGRDMLDYVAEQILAFCGRL